MKKKIGKKKLFKNIETFLRKKIVFFFFCGNNKKYPEPGYFFLGLVDPSWNRLASTAYFAIVSSVFCLHRKIQIKSGESNRQNRKKNQISYFSNFYFSSYGHFCSKTCQFSFEFSRQLEKWKSENWFSIRFSTFRVIHENRIKTEGGGDLHVWTGSYIYIHINQIEHIYIYLLIHIYIYMYIYICMYMNSTNYQRSALIFE